jgi:hypothetical protein
MFEYKLVHNAVGNLELALNKLGAQGWQAIGFDMQRHVLMTRELPDPTAAPANKNVPYVSGAGFVTETLSCTVGEWDGEPYDYDWVWRRDGDPIPGAARSTYYVVAADVDHVIDCVVTAANLVGETAAPPSNGVLAIPF